MEINFNGKRALVTGAGRGIGRGLVKRLVKYGATVVALSRTESHLQTLKEECPSIEIICVDVGDWEATRIALKNIGHLDLLVNNAAMANYSQFGDITEEIFDRLLSVNVKAPLNIMQLVVRSMKENGTGGSIVNISSAAVDKASSKMIPYAACKAALDRITKLTAVDLGQHKIRLNSVNPGFVNTDMSDRFKRNEEIFKMIKSQIPLGDFAEVSDTVDAIVYLLSDRAAMIHGACLFVDGGVTAR